jgi:arylsulfatase A-like enzyme
MNRTTLLTTLFIVGLCAPLLRCQEQQPRATAHSGLAPLHLALQLDQAEVEGSAPASAAEERHWSLADPDSGWKLLDSNEHPMLASMESQQLDDGIRLTLVAGGRGPFRVGGLGIELGELRFGDWEKVVVRARSSDRFAGVTVRCNLSAGGGLPSMFRFFDSNGDVPPIFNDGSIQNYAIPLESEDTPRLDKTLRSLGILFAAPGKASLDVLSITLVPRGAEFEGPWGALSLAREGVTYHTLYAHAPSRLSFPLDGAATRRLDFALTVNRGDRVTYKVLTEAAGQRQILFEETVADSRHWQQRSLSLENVGAGSDQLTLEATSEQPGTVALWGAPIVCVDAADQRPNVIFYVIDGGDADLMSLYEYERPTTPFLEELAKEGVLFTRAYSNSTWTQPSTVSFMTSLHHSVLGGLRRGIHSTALPTAALPMSDHFRRAGYQTASFTANPNAGRIIGIDRGMDVMRDIKTQHHSTSSLDLHDYFFEFRGSYPGGPYWVHFQTTDVHEPNDPHEPFAGKFTTPEDLTKLEEWDQKIWQTAAQHFGTTSIMGFYDLAIDSTGIDRKQYFGIRRSLYDETMLHQDHALEKLVAQLKERGEWQNTILVIGSDHGHPAGTFARFGRGEFVPQPEPWQGALFDAYATRVPFLILWPGKIEGGRKIDQPVSMIDVMPTLLELAGLPPAEVLQGQSLVPLLQGKDQELAPVILDEFRIDEASGEMIGNLEIIDGRWGASLEIGPVPEGADPSRGRHAVPAGGRWGAVHPYFPDVPRLLLYDLEKDPFATRCVNDEHPELVEHYTQLLLEQWQAHQALAQQFSESDEGEMTPEQLEQLRALGYIR